MGTSHGPTQNAALAQATGTAPGKILLAFAPGGVLTRDGTLWTFRPDKGVWMTIDEGFQEEGHPTHILPLPVPVTDIVEMESFGFLVTRSGDCWLYDLEKDRWRETGPPPRKL